MKSDKPFSPYRYLPFIIIVLLLIKVIFTGNTFSWFVTAIKPAGTVLILVYLFNPLVEFYQRHFKTHRTLPAAMAYITILLVIVTFLFLLVPSVVSSTQMLLNNSPTTDEIVQIVSGIPFLSDYLQSIDLNQLLASIQNMLITYAKNLMQYSTQLISSVTSVLTAIGVFILSVLISFYALKDNKNIGQNIELVLRALLPENITKSIFKIAPLADKAVKSFLIGKLYTCFTLGLTVGILIFFFNLFAAKDIPYILLMSFVIGMTNLIPYLGPIIGTVPCLFIALFSGFWPSVALLIIVIISQQIDNVFISPKIIGDSVGLRPYWVILSVIIGGGLFGAIGMIIMVPVTSVILQLVQEKVDSYSAQQLATKITSSESTQNTQSQT